MARVLLIDFRSTYTKVAAVDLNREKRLGSARSPSTVGSDIMIGFNGAKEALGEAGKD